VRLRWTILVSVAVLLSACGSSPGADTGSKDVPPGEEDLAGNTASDDTSEDTSDDSLGTLGTVEELSAALAADHSKEEWYPYLSGMTLETFLGAPVLLLRVTWDNTDQDYEGKNDRSQAMLAALQAYESPLLTNIATLDGSGNLFGLGSTSEYGAMPMADRFDLPPAPTTAAELTAWLATVYGPGGLVTLGPDEAWYASIQGIGPGPDSPLTVVTTLATGDPLGMNLLVLALQTSGSALLAGYMVLNSEGYGPAGYAPAGEPGIWGYYYFP
jgi:hypothetical protein